MARREFAPRQPQVILSLFGYQVLEAIFDITDSAQATPEGVANCLNRSEAEVEQELMLLARRGLAVQEQRTGAFAPTSAALPYKVAPRKVRRGVWPFREVVGWTI